MTGKKGMKIILLYYQNVVENKHKMVILFVLRLTFLCMNCICKRCRLIINEVIFCITKHNFKFRLIDLLAFLFCRATREV